MKRLPRVVSAATIIHGDFKRVVVDRYEDVVDRRPPLAEGKVFAWRLTPGNVRSVRVDEYGRSISWTDDTGYTIDLGADSLRRDGERRVEVHTLQVG